MQPGIETRSGDLAQGGREKVSVSEVQTVAHYRIGVEIAARLLLFQELAVALDRADVVADQMVEARAGNVWRPSVDVVNKTVDLVRLELEFLEEMLGNLQECESIQLVACNVSAKARGWAPVGA